MAAKLLVDTIEIGIVTTNMAAMRDFYENLVGLPYQEQLDFPGGTMHRYQCGANVLKLVAYDKPPGHANNPGGGEAATGLRYFTLMVENLSEFIEEVKQADHTIAKDVTPFGADIGFAFVEDPDGNWLELAGPV
jgi:catechol 2,3-dioxygenase-like lactoylglutathione lyase family enzyme